ncbi:MAG: FixH family protein [Bacteroidetes bacterium]|nr:FixH family protein [Bacteroidota bacterium]
MKSIFKMILATLFLAITLVSCRNSEDNITETTNELQDLKLIKETSNDKHIIELYSASGQLSQGYHDVFIRIKNKATGLYENNAEIQWQPVMHMTSMSHSCPKSAVTKIAGNNLYTGYIVFTMVQNASEYWDIKIDYTINGNNYTTTTVLDVPASPKRVVTSFKGSDNVKYILAYIHPKNPKVATNDLTVGVWKMEDMMNFSVVDGYTVKIDPRMPSMGNHSSPNNIHATQKNAGGLYYGKLSLTMTGYWKINLQLANTSGNILKGEEISDSTPASSIFFELEF